MYNYTFIISWGEEGRGRAGGIGKARMAMAAPRFGQIK